MSMSKEKIVAVVGVSVFVIAAGGLGYFLYDAYDQRVAQEEELESQMSAFRSYQNEDPFPSPKSIAGVVSNKASMAAWRVNALDLAARGDWAPAEESPAQFKQRLQAEVRRMAELAGGVDGRIAAPAFLFGFEQYLGENGELPKTADVPRLVRELDFITRTVEAFAAADGVEVKEIKRLGAPKVDADEEAKKKKKNARGKAAAEKEPSRLDYSFVFAVRPASFVAVLNALTAEERFCVVTRLAFRESADMIVDKLNAADPANQKKAEGGGRRRGRRGAAAPAENAAPAKVDRLVVDPELDAPIALSLTLSVYDFGHGAAPAAAETAPAPAAGSDKSSKEAK